MAMIMSHEEMARANARKFYRESHNDAIGGPAENAWVEEHWRGFVWKNRDYSMEKLVADYNQIVSGDRATGIYEPDLEAKRQAKARRARRDRIAEGFAFALVSGGYESRPRYVAEPAVKLADALIAELDK